MTKIYETAIDDGKDLDSVMPMYNLLEYSSNYSDKTGSSWFHLKDVATNFNVNIASNVNFKYFKYNNRLIKNTDADRANGVLRKATIAVPLKYVSNFWRSLEMSLINCKVELRLKWTNYCILFANGSSNTINDVIFTIKDTTLYVPAVT